MPRDTTTVLDLPEACPDGEHLAVIVHRTGGRDANYWNVCGKCGRQISRMDGEPWRMDMEDSDAE
jgi:hypothetical protein